MTRSLHPGAWWGWALGCAVVSARTTNPILLGLVIALICATVLIKRTAVPWAMAFRMYVYLAVFIMVLRVGFRILFSADGPTVILDLPSVQLPGVFSGVRLFGPVSAEALIGTAQSGLQLAAMVLAVGAANALANPKRLLAAVPGALYEWGTVVIIAISVFPQLAESVVRVGRARQLRAETGRGVHLIRNVMMPVLSDGLDRSLLLAGAMDSRGYGRSAQVPTPQRHWTSGLLLGATVAIGIGAYGLLDSGGTPIWMGVPMVVGGLVLGVVGLRLSGRRVTRTRYRPDPWRGLEWLVLGAGVVAVVGIVVVGVLRPSVLNPPVGILAWPSTDLAAVLAVLVLALPMVLAPDPLPVGKPGDDGVGDDVVEPLRLRAGFLRPGLGDQLYGSRTDVGSVVS